MSFGIEGFAAVRPVRVELITAAYAVSGTIQTRFTRVADILNQLTATHVPVGGATIVEHGFEDAVATAEAIVSVDEILVMLAPDLASAPAGEMRVQKEPVRAELAIFPLSVSGMVYVPVGSRPMDGLLNVPDRFVPMTDVTIASAREPSLERSAAVVAVRRDRAHVIRFPEDASADEASPLG